MRYKINIEFLTRSNRYGQMFPITRTLVFYTNNIRVFQLIDNNYCALHESGELKT